MSAPRGAGGRPLRGPLVMLLPVAVFAAGIFLLSRRPHESYDADPPRASDPEEMFAGFTGRADAPGGTTIHVRLTTLHPDLERQKFEAAVLRERLALEEGEPWRLNVRWLPAPDMAAELTTGLLLDNVRIEDGTGIALRTLDWDAPQGGLHDPLRVLLRVPDGALTPGTTLDLILWGRDPGAEAQVVGWIESESAGRERRALALAPEPIRRRELGGPLAKLDRRDGKKPVAPSSGPGAGGGSSDND